MLHETLTPFRVGKYFTLAMEIKCESTLPERIIAVQKQLKIAIQNYQLMLQRKQLLQNRDDRILPHLEIIQFIMINIGRTQTSLLNQYRNEIASKYNWLPNDRMVTNVMKANLTFPDAPKDIPIYKPKVMKENDVRKTPQLKPKLKSVLKVKNKEYIDHDKNKSTKSTGITSCDNSKIKIICAKKKDGGSFLMEQGKRLQSVLKPRNSQSERAADGSSSPLSVSSDDSKSQPSPNSVLDEIDLTYSPPLSKIDNRYGKKYEAKLLNSTKTKPPSESSQTRSPPLNKRVLSDSDVKEQDQDDQWVPFPVAVRTETSFYKIKKLDDDPTSLYELDQESFLGIFALHSKRKSEMLLLKRGERKRRSLAGQNSLYSDYLQPLPRRSYSSRKAVSPVQSSSGNSVIIESSTGDDDEDEFKDKTVCLICHEGGDTCVLESCCKCNENFHTNCVPPSQRGNCPSPICMGQKTISNIVVGDSLPSINLDGEQTEVANRYLRGDCNQVSYRKYCIVPGCSSTTTKFPDKKFITLPRNIERRNLWLKAIRRGLHDLSPRSCLFVCEDHFDLEEDVENFTKFKIYGGGPVKLKSGVVPHKFSCQPDRTEGDLKVLGYQLNNFEAQQ